MINKSKQQNFRLFFCTLTPAKFHNQFLLQKFAFSGKILHIRIKKKKQKKQTKKAPNKSKKTKKRVLNPERKNTLNFLKITKKKEKEKIEKKCLMQGACVSCRQCIGCERSKVRNCGRSLCFDARGVVNCGYFGLCSGSKVDVVACKLYIRK